MKLNYFIISLTVLAVSLIGSFFTGSGMEWYRTISLPSWTPAGSVIGSVWTVLFILSAVSAILVWNGERGANFKIIIFAFLANALLNIFWSVVFFYWHALGWAVFEAVILGASVLLLIILIWPSSRLAATLLIPYFLWVSFASYLSYNIWILNK